MTDYSRTLRAMQRHPVVYLTGAPATGKTSVARYLVERFGARRYSYGEALSHKMQDQGYSHEDLRTQSGAIIKRQLIAELDAQMPDQVQLWVRDGPVVIDTHAVTSERWGLRSIPYSAEVLRAIGATHLVCLSAGAGTLQARIKSDSGGRPVESEVKLAQLEQAQIAVLLAYAHTLGGSAFIVDANRPLGDVQRDVAALCGLEAAAG